MVLHYFITYLTEMQSKHKQRLTRNAFEMNVFNVTQAFKNDTDELGQKIWYVVMICENGNVYI